MDYVNSMFVYCYCVFVYFQFVSGKLSKRILSQAAAQQREIHDEEDGGGGDAAATTKTRTNRKSSR